MINILIGIIGKLQRSVVSTLVKTFKTRLIWGKFLTIVQPTLQPTCPLKTLAENSQT